MKAVTLTLGAVAVGVSLGVAVLLYQRYGSSGVGFGVRAYAVESDSLVRVDFEVDKDPSRTAVCTVRARDSHGAEVGSDPVTVGPAPHRSVLVTHRLATVGRANTGEVTACVLQVPAHSLQVPAPASRP